MINIERLHTLYGDKKIKVDDSKPEERHSLATDILNLVRKGHAVFVTKGGVDYRVRGYDAMSNEWILADTPSVSAPEAAPAPPDEVPKKRRGRLRKLPASDTTATSVPPNAGG